MQIVPSFQVLDNFHNGKACLLFEVVYPKNGVRVHGTSVLLKKNRGSRGNDRKHGNLLAHICSTSCNIALAES